MAAPLDRARLEIRLTVDGEKRVIRSSDLNALDARDLREELGVTLLDAIVSPHDLSCLAGLLWLVRRKREPDLTFRQVAEKLTHDSITDLDVTNRDKTGDDGSDDEDESDVEVEDPEA